MGKTTQAAKIEGNLLGPVTLGARYQSSRDGLRLTALISGSPMLVRVGTGKEHRNAAQRETLDSWLRRRHKAGEIQVSHEVGEIQVTRQTASN